MLSSGLRLATELNIFTITSARIVSKIDQTRTDKRPKLPESTFTCNVAVKIVQTNHRRALSHGQIIRPRELRRFATDQARHGAKEDTRALPSDHNYLQKDELASICTKRWQRSRSGPRRRLTQRPLATNPPQRLAIEAFQALRPPPNMAKTTN